MERAELAAWLRLMLTPGLGGSSVRRLLAAFGPPEAIFAQSEAALRTALGHARAHDQARALMEPPADWHEQTERTWAWLQEDAAHRAIVTLADAEAQDGPSYPTPLLHIEDPPPLLYMHGRLDLLPRSAAHDPWDMARHIAIVGSRNPTPQGLLNARQFGHALREAGLTIVSGLALGIDGAAHEGALDGTPSNEELATLAITGTGLDIDYPRSHRTLSRRISESGLIISEYALGTPPLAPNFPRRNRLIAGLSCATLVVEAAPQSGSLITARMASEQGRDVFAIPGSIHSAQSRGSHALIKQGAKLVESVADILEELAGRMTSRPAMHTRRENVTASSAEVNAAEDETPLLAALGSDPVSLDALQARSGLPIAQLQAELTVLELEGLVARLPGGLLQRLAQG